MNLVPHPRKLVRSAGRFRLPVSGILFLPPDLPRSEVMLPVANRLIEAAEAVGCRLELVTSSRPPASTVILATRHENLPRLPQISQLEIKTDGIQISFREVSGLRAAVATLRQLFREYGRDLPCLSIRDYPDFERRGIMLDVSRGRVPNLSTLLDLVDRLADFKVNELQLYIEHTFAYSGYEGVWKEWGPLTAEDILRLDARCRELGISLVPNQNSFGHLRYWLEHPKLKRLAEVTSPYPSPDGTFWRYPTTLAPENPGTLPFVEKLYDELLPCFTAKEFNVGCDETWDLGRGQSKAACEHRGKGRVYLDFLLKIHKQVARRDMRMMFWADIILNHPELIDELPRDVVAVNWGYEANHPFERETGLLEKSGIPFYVCPGTSTWMTLIGRHDNAFVNLRNAAQSGRRHRASGYLNTDWGDGGHPQPLAVSYAPFLVGAAESWCGESYDESALRHVLSRDVFEDPTCQAAEAALNMGLAHKYFGYLSPNTTPFGTVVAAPPPETHELACRDGLKLFARIPGKNVRKALEAVESERARLYRSKPATARGEMLAAELDMAARMAAQSCHFMLWQQAVADNRSAEARRMAKAAIRSLHDLQHDFEAYWPWRNKGTPEKCSSFLDWRIRDYKTGRLPYSPEQARLVQARTYSAE